MTLWNAARAVAGAVRRRGAPLLAVCALSTVLGGAATATWAAHEEPTGPSPARRPTAPSSPTPTFDPAAVQARHHAPASQPILDPLPQLILRRVDHSPPARITPFDEHGYIRTAAMDAIAHAFRASNGCEVPIHPRLTEILIGLSQAFDNRPVTIVSGHREPGHGTRTSSYHVAGLAADVAIIGVRSVELVDVADRLGAGGIGYYGTFVHVDVRDDVPFRWSRGRRGHVPRHHRRHR